MSKFPNHINSIYLSYIYEEIIHQFSYVGLVLSCHGGLETVNSPHINSEIFPSQHGTLTNCWFNIGQRRRRWTNIKTTFGQFLVEVVSCN